MNTLEKKMHWDNLYAKKASNETSWFEEIPKISLNFVANLKIPKSAKIIDIGGGDSMFVDHLILKDYENITVLDISKNAIEQAKSRLGEKSKKIKWIIGDITEYEFNKTYDFWHDRAVFHFLTHKDEIEKYAIKVNQILKTNGHLVIGTFAKDGPKKCSGLEISQYSSNMLIERFKTSLSKIECFETDHITPFDSIQKFTFCSFKKTSGKENIISQSAGDSSKLYQAGRDLNINQMGISYNEVKEVALDVFERNAMKFGEIARKVAYERVENFVQKVSMSLSTNTTIDGLKEPFFQFTLFNALNEYARLGDEELGDILSDILTERVHHDNRSFCQIVLDSCIKIVPTLTKAQLNALTIVFVLTELRDVLPEVPNFEDFANQSIAPFIGDLPYDKFEYRHFYSVRCCALGGSETFRPNLFELIKSGYTQIENLNDSELKDKLTKIDPKFSSMIKLWETTRLAHLKLTSVGLAIAVANYRKVTGHKVNITSCFKK